MAPAVDGVPGPRRGLREPSGVVQRAESAVRHRSPPSTLAPKRPKGGGQSSFGQRGFGAYLLPPEVFRRRPAPRARLPRPIFFANSERWAA